MNWFNFECFWRNDTKPLQPSKEKKLRLENKKIGANKSPLLILKNC